MSKKERIWRPRLLLRPLRIHADLNQSGLAERLGCSQARVAAWENGDRFPSWGVLKDIADVLGCAKLSELIDMTSRFDTEYEPADEDAKVALPSGKRRKVKVDHGAQRKSAWQPILLARQRRVASRLTDSDLAERLGVGRNIIWRWESGTHFPSWSALRDLGICLGCTMLSDLIDPDSRFDEENEPVMVPTPDNYPEGD